MLPYAKLPVKSQTELDSVDGRGVASRKALQTLVPRGSQRGKAQRSGAAAGSLSGKMASSPSPIGTQHLAAARPIAGTWRSKARAH